jgi:hypothetical protein
VRKSTLLNRVVGETHEIRALDSASQPVTGLTWSSSDAVVVSVGSTEPMVLTAMAPGHATVTAGGASVDVTVWAAGTEMPVGTVLWSNPGIGQVTRIVPAVPSATGVADVFAYSGNGSSATVQAITSEGLTAWKASLGDFHTAGLYPDFQGGLVVVEEGTPLGPPKVVKLDGITASATRPIRPTRRASLYAPPYIRTAPSSPFKRGARAIP